MVWTGWCPEQVLLPSVHWLYLHGTNHNIDVAIFGVAVVGAVLGFLVFNAHPAKVFMGDTGSLALGGAIATDRHFNQDWKSS